MSDINEYVTIDLRAAGLAHATGKSDRCGNDGHDVSWQHVKDWENLELIEFGGIYDHLQILHEQAHPDGVAYWENCRKLGCADIWDEMMHHDG